jgi:hypothetical protein
MEGEEVEKSGEESFTWFLFPPSIEGEGKAENQKHEKC